MAGGILVPLKRDDRIEGILPYLEKITQPGVRVLFLIPYSVKSRLSWRDRWVTAPSSREAMLVERRIMSRYSWEVQRGLAEQKIFPVRKALQKRKVNVAVEVYTGSLRKTIRDYTADGGANLIMVPARGGIWTLGLLQRSIPFLGLVKPLDFSSVLLLRLDQT